MKLLAAIALFISLHAGAAEPARRVITLIPSLTETVCTLGACDRLVAVDDYSNWPDSVQRLPHVGGLDDANIERIVALKPDLVLLHSTSRAAARLQSLGVRTLSLELKTLADARRALHAVADALGVQGADAVWRRIEDGVDAAAASLPPPLRGTTVYYEVSSGGYAASESSHIGEMLKRLGVVNVVPGSLGSVPKLNPEFAVRADPQVIMVGEWNSAELLARPGWRRISAVRNGRVCTFRSAQADVIGRPGPRLAESARYLVDCLTGRLAK